MSSLPWLGVRFFFYIQKAFISKGRSITQTIIQLRMSIHQNILYKIQHEACNQEKPHIQNDFYKTHIDKKIHSPTE